MVKNMKMIKVTIDRTKWSRGNVYDNKLLVGVESTPPLEMTNRRPTEVGKMCCLGFVCLALGAAEHEIKDMSMPSDLKRELAGLNKHNPYGMGAYSYDDTTFSSDASAENDKPDISNEEREATLIELANAYGFEFEFIN